MEGQSQGPLFASFTLDMVPVFIPSAPPTQRMLVPADPYQGTSISPVNHLGGFELGKPAAPLVCLLLIQGIKVWKWREGASIA